MKKIIIAGILNVMLTFSYLLASAQEERIPTPKWVSDKGYWVVESNIKTPRNHSIRFYNNEDLLIYTETLEGVKLNVKRKKVKMKLKQVLESAVLAWEGKESSLERLAVVKKAL